MFDVNRQPTNLVKLGVLVLQACCTICAVVLGVWVKLPWPGLVALGLLGGSMGLAGLLAQRGDRFQRRLFGTAWVCTVAAPASVFLARSYIPDCYYGVMAWLMALTVVVAGWGNAPLKQAPRGRGMAMAWGLLGCGLWLTGSYWQDAAVAFYAGLVVSIGLLVLCHFWFRLSGWVFQAVNTGILFLVALPVVNLFLHPAYRPDWRPETGRNLYSYKVAQGDPDAFDQWWNYYLDQWDRMGAAVFVPHPPGGVPVKLRPSSTGYLFESKITINSLGFRGKEVALDKGNAYRIVALGESTTFGVTLRAEDKTWPELLEQMIVDRLHPKRPVQVINAGVPTINLKHNLLRMQKEILPLHPDLIISYHGANGFGLLDAALPSRVGTVPPCYRERPLKLLANFEFRLKVLYYRHLQGRPPHSRPPTVPDAMASPYAEAYRELIELCRSNHIALVLANYCMAVNGKSDTRIRDFYGTTYPLVERMIRANELHSELLRRLAEQNPELCLVDTHPGLDGHEERFIDLLHFTQPGRQQLAENIFAGMRPLLEKELTKGR